MIRFLRTAACRRSNRLPLFAILVAIWAANGSPGVGSPVPFPGQAVAQAPATLIQMDHVSVQVVGTGSPIILIPGLSSPRGVWDGVVPELAKRHRLYLVQVKGLGGDAPGANLDTPILDGVISDLHALIQREKLGRVAVVGHSMGGLAGLMLTKAHSGEVARLMVVDALPFVGAIFVPGATVDMLKPQAEQMRDQMVSLHGSTVPDAVAQSIAATNALKPASQAKVAAWTKASDMRVSGKALYEDMTTDLRGDLATIAVPITLVYPWADARLPQARADAFYRAEYATAPSVSFVGIGDSGHFVMLDQPEAFAQALAAFAG